MHMQIRTALYRGGRAHGFKRGNYDDFERAIGI
jgi:hypothetical protein